MVKHKLVCPNCRNDRFQQRHTEIVHILDDGDCMENRFIEDTGDYLYCCENCGKDIEEEELVKGEEWKEED